MSARQQPSVASDVFTQLGLGSATLRSRETSAVTSAWGVDWSEEWIARDLMQNFFDANRKQLEKVVVTSEMHRVRVAAPAAFDLRHLFFLGSEKGEDDVGQHGEGFKAAAACILRRQGTSVISASGKEGVIIHLADAPAVGKLSYPLIYEFYDLEQPAPGSLLVVEGAWPALSREVERGLTHFFHPQNALIGKLVATDGSGNAFQFYRSTTDGGHIFYRHLRRGDIPDLPIVLVLNKPYARIEKEVAKDRDRKAFGESLRDTFYSVWASSFFRDYYYGKQQLMHIARPLWERGSGHPLLAAIARSMHHRWPEKQAADYFGDRFYAESHSHAPGEAGQYEEFESQWRREGRTKLPSYFESFGVISARVKVQQLHDAAKQEARKKGAKRPSPAEATAIDVLRKVLHELAPKIALLFDEKRTSYTVAATSVLQGEFKRGRHYDSSEIFLTAELFEYDFAEALAVFLHEHAHIRGYDGSRDFTDALTHLLESVVRQRHSLEDFESKWNHAKKIVGDERKSSVAGDGQELQELQECDRDALLAILGELPKTMVRAALRRHTKKES